MDSEKAPRPVLAPAEIMALWAELKETVAVLELDIVKNVNGNASAGVSSRRGLRIVRAAATGIMRAMVARDQELRAARKLKRDLQKAAAAAAAPVVEETEEVEEDASVVE